jgi:hypothetical protein
MADTTASTSSTSRSHTDLAVLTFPPIVHVIWGLMLLAGMVIGTMMQVQTTQAWVLGVSADWHPNFNIFSQFPQFWNGGMDAAQFVAFIVGWGSQFVLMTIKIGLARAQTHVMQRYAHGIAPSDAALRSARLRMGFWSLVSWGIVIGDSLTDWLFVSQMGFLQHLLYVLVLFLSTFYFGTWGIHNLAAGLDGMKDK